MTIWQSVRRKNWHQFAGKRWRHVLGLHFHRIYLYASLSESDSTLPLYLWLYARLCVCVWRNWLKDYVWVRLPSIVARKEGGENACRHGCLAILMPKWWKFLRKGTIQPTFKSISFPKCMSIQFAIRYFSIAVIPKSLQSQITNRDMECNKIICIFIFEFISQTHLLAHLQIIFGLNQNLHILLASILTQVGISPLESLPILCRANTIYICLTKMTFHKIFALSWTRRNEGGSNLLAPRLIGDLMVGW